MEKLAVCRICLSEDIRMQLKVDTHLQEIFERLTDKPFETKDIKPILVCYLCCSRLQKCYELKMDCLRTEDYFIQMLNNDIKTVKKQEVSYRTRLTITPITHFGIGWGYNESLNDNVKTEMYTEQTTEVHIEAEQDIPNTVFEEDCSRLDDNVAMSDSDDDVPLKNIKDKTEKKVKKRRKHRLMIRKKESDVKSSTALKIDAHEILLSKEEQINNLIARSKSVNYTFSPYRCDLCYKGFIDEKAYENHKIKHEKRSGLFVCDICHMRYPTGRHLKTHVVTAHSRLFKCNKCGHTTHTANQAKVHEQWHNGFMYECKLCGHKFKKPTSHLSHMRKRHPTENVCDICGDSFIGKLGLQMHKSKTHNDMSNESNEEPAAERYCVECDIQFYSREAWKRHILCSIKHKLTNDTSECKICGWRGDSTSLSNHMREHSRSLRQRRPITLHTSDRIPCHCTQCGVKFVSRQKLQSHVNRIHLGVKYNKNIVCEVCGRHCTSNATLKYHQRTHTGERPYSCSTCSKQFSNKNLLRIHTRTHTGEKPYECSVCRKRFSQKPALNRHYRVHTGDKPYSCQQCSRTFTQSNSLKLHVRTVHLKVPEDNRKNEDVKIEQKT